MEKFKEVVAKNEKLEMIHISLDHKKEAAQKWAASEKFPWYTILFEDVESSGLWGFNQTGGVPEYVLVSASGEKVGTGPGVFEQAKELSAK